MAEIIIMPKLGFDMTEGILIRWLKTEGDEISEGEVIAEIETDKATVEVESNFSGIVRKRVVEEGAIVPIGNPIAIVGEADEEIDFEAVLKVSGQAKEAEAVDQPAEAERKTSEELEPVVDGNGHLPGGVKASPVARRLAKDHGIDLKSISGTGQGGRIVKHDVESYLESGGDDVTSTPIPSVSALPIPTMGEMGEMEGSEIPLSKLRSLIGQRMAQAKQQLPHFYLTAEINAAPMMELRAKINEHLPEGENLSVNDFIIKAAALTLREFPNLNASLGENKIIRHGEINIGVAVAVEDGLLTVVVHNADIKPLRLISQDARNAVRRAREGRVRPDDIQGSTFTVSNLGMFDIDNFIAIINPPEAAILAIGSVAEVPIVQGDGIVAGKRVKVTLSADHRVTDGAEAARWLQIFKGFLEDPLLLLNLSALLS
jgi:pyruvate dehydrogenase E2 component (dihydrolipoamide acetyltransferase)